MMKGRNWRLLTLLAQLALSNMVWPQVPFQVDQSFSTGLATRFVADLAMLPDGSILISGPITYPGENINQPRYGAKLHPDGSRDLSFTPYPGMGGRMVLWENRFYCGAGQIVRRLQMNGTLDPEFIMMNDGPYFTSLQGGDYHVYPDGRLLMSGAHMLRDSIRGFEGLYSLIWFSNEGYLDTTRTHRLCNGVIYAIEEQPDGKFLCTGTMTTYEGQPVSRVFRVEADGTLDPSFVAEVQALGEARSYFVLPDGRILIGGSLRLLDSPQVRSLIRLNSDGSLDESFNLLNIEATFTPSQIPNVSSIYELAPDRYIITGLFDKINGQDRGGIAMIDSSGALVEDVFDGMGCGAYEFVQSSGSTTYKSIAGIVPSNDGGYFIYGAYHGYDDGTTNDTTQRMVSKLYGLSVGVDEPAAPLAATLRMYPNPASAYVVFEADGGTVPTMLLITDLQGRTVRSVPCPAGALRMEVPLLGLTAGQYIAQITGFSPRLLTIAP